MKLCLIASDCPLWSKWISVHAKTHTPQNPFQRNFDIDFAKDFSPRDLKAPKFQGPIDVTIDAMIKSQRYIDCQREDARTSLPCESCQCYRSTVGLRGLRTSTRGGTHFCVRHWRRGLFSEDLEKGSPPDHKSQFGFGLRPVRAMVLGLELFGFVGTSTQETAERGVLSGPHVDLPQSREPFLRGHVGFSASLC